jgi:hypothetical protein
VGIAGNRNNWQALSEQDKKTVPEEPGGAKTNANVKL